MFAKQKIKDEKREMITLEDIFGKMVDFDIPLGRVKKYLGYKAGDRIGIFWRHQRKR